MLVMTDELMLETMMTFSDYSRSRIQEFTDDPTYSLVGFVRCEYSPFERPFNLYNQHCVLIVTKPLAFSTLGNSINVYYAVTINTTLILRAAQYNKIVNDEDVMIAASGCVLQLFGNWPSK